MNREKWVEVALRYVGFDAKVTPARRRVEIGRVIDALQGRKLVLGVQDFYWPSNVAAQFANDLMAKRQGKKGSEPGGEASGSGGGASEPDVGEPVEVDDPHCDAADPDLGANEYVDFNT